MANPNIKDHAHKGGRPPGSKDKISRSVKERVIAVWDELEKSGQSLQDVASNDPQWFYANFVKVLLPKEVEAKVQGEMGVKFVTNALTPCLKSDTTAET